MTRPMLALLILWSTAAYAQHIPNGDFEEWTLTEGSGQFKSYYEPSHGWASGNGAIHIAAGADPVCEQTTDVVHGALAAKLTTRRIFGQIASGSLYTGMFKLNLADPAKSALRGIPFTGTPSAFTGWYKYLPVGADSATLYATLSRWDGTKRKHIAEARIMQYTALSEWTRFSVPFVYQSSEPPDTIAVVFASSAGGEFFRGNEGSTLYVDNVQVENASTIAEHQTPPSATFTIQHGTMQFHMPVQQVHIFSLHGEHITCSTQSVVSLSGIPSGVYCIVAEVVGGFVIRTVVAVP